MQVQLQVVSAAALAPLVSVRLREYTHHRSLALVFSFCRISFYDHLVFLFYLFSHFDNRKYLKFYSPHDGDCKNGDKSKCASTRKSPESTRGKREKIAGWPDASTGRERLRLGAAIGGKGAIAKCELIMKFMNAFVIEWLIKM